jgi:hypothetical protein
MSNDQRNLAKMDGASRRRHLVDGLVSIPQRLPSEYQVYNEDSETRAIEGSTGKVKYTNATPDTVLSSVLADLVSGGAVTVRPALYGAEVSATVNKGHHVVNEVGATNINWTITSGATAILEDHQGKHYVHQESGTVWYRVSYNSGTLLPGPVTLDVGAVDAQGQVSIHSGLKTDVVVEKNSGQKVTFNSEVVLSSTTTVQYTMDFTVASGSPAFSFNQTGDTAPKGAQSGNITFNSGFTGYLEAKAGGVSVYIPYWIA